MNKNRKILVVVTVFPSITETFILNQITDLIKLGKCPNKSCVGDQGSNLNNQISEITCDVRINGYRHDRPVTQVRSPNGQHRRCG